MKTSLLASVSFGALALATSAQAADMPARPVYKAPVAAPVWSWAGFYIGGNVGIAQSRSSITDEPGGAPFLTGALGVSSIDTRKTGVIGGLQAGYNWQFNSLVVGVEGDISFGSLNASTNLFGTDTYSSKLNALGTLRGRVGWAVDRFLVYGTGGVALASLSDQLVDTPVGFTAGPTSNAFGWVAGGGVEYALSGPWIVRAEYLHVGFENRHTTVSPGTTYVFAFKDSIDIGRVGINYKF